MQGVDRGLRRRSRSTRKSWSFWDSWTSRNPSRTANGSGLPISSQCFYRRKRSSRINWMASSIHPALSVRLIMWRIYMTKLTRWTKLGKLWWISVSSFCFCSSLFWSVIWSVEFVACRHGNLCGRCLRGIDLIAYDEVSEPFDRRQEDDDTIISFENSSHRESETFQVSIKLL